MQTKTKAALFLFFFSSISAELLTGSAPPLEYMIIGPPLLIPFYGSGVLLVHELAARWEKGWPTILLLGAVFGIIEEGLMVMSFFNPTWVDIGILGSYGRALGVNWVWTVSLTVFHSLFSITIPIIFKQLIFPDLKGPLLADKALKKIGGLFIVATLAGTFVVYKGTGFLAPLPQYIFLVLVTIALFYLAKVFPHKVFTKRIDQPKARPLLFWLLGFLFFGLFQILSTHFMPKWNFHPLFSVLMMLAISLVTIFIVEKKIGTVENEKHKLALAVGIQSFIIVFTLLREMEGMRGMAVVGVLYIAFLVWLKKRVSNYITKEKLAESI